MALSVGSIAGDMVTAAASKAGDEWKKIKSVATVQLRSLAHNLVEIARSTANGSLDATTAKQLTAMAKNNAIAMVAMLTQMVFGAIQRIINAALAVVKSTRLPGWF
jgi:hypothetical protein